MPNSKLDSSKKNAKAIFVANVKGGVGKSTLSIMLARTLADRIPTQNITVIDTDKGEETLISIEDVLVLNEIKETVGELLPDAVIRKRHFKNALIDIYRSTTQANLIYDGIETQSRKVSARQSGDSW